MSRWDFLATFTDHFVWLNFQNFHLLMTNTIPTVYEQFSLWWLDWQAVNTIFHPWNWRDVILSIFFLFRISVFVGLWLELGECLHGWKFSPVERLPYLQSYLGWANFNLHSFYFTLTPSVYTASFALASGSWVTLGEGSSVCKIGWPLRWRDNFFSCKHFDSPARDNSVETVWLALGGKQRSPC